MSDHDEVTSASLTAYSQAYWRFCSIALGIALLISLAINASGPARAGAASVGESPVQSAPAATSSPSAHSVQGHDPSGRLSVGGFEAYQETPVFVIVDQDGNRVGILPMSAATPATQP